VGRWGDGTIASKKVKQITFVICRYLKKITVKPI